MKINTIKLCTMSERVGFCGIFVFKYHNLYKDDVKEISKLLNILEKLK